MLGKLMKYEFMAMGRVFLPMYGALIAITLVNRLLALLPAQAPMVISTVIAAIIIAAIFVVTFILIIQRFRKNLLSEEGYLMMTLPVRTDSLILSKLFVATIFTFASAFVAILAIVILSGVGVATMFQVLVDAFPYIGAQEGLAIFQALILLIFSIFSGVLLLYTCMALSMLVNKCRGLFAFGAYVAITTIMQILAAIVISVLTFSGAGRSLSNFFDGAIDGSFARSQIAVGIIFVVILAIGSAFYFTTRHMLKRRLNLQ
ncbi:MAG: hypothetical protein FWC13_13580 [Oscillospiraceae bacterium]|nr:hypothetical protein [Oscillospiraceae bacterium]